MKPCSEMKTVYAHDAKNIQNKLYWNIIPQYLHETLFVGWFP